MKVFRLPWCAVLLILFAAAVGSKATFGQRVEPSPTPPQITKKPPRTPPTPATLTVENTLWTYKVMTDYRLGFLSGGNCYRERATVGPTSMVDFCTWTQKGKSISVKGTSRGWWIKGQLTLPNPRKLEGASIEAETSPVLGQFETTKTQVWRLNQHPSRPIVPSLVGTTWVLNSEQEAYEVVFAKDLCRITGPDRQRQLGMWEQDGNNIEFSIGGGRFRGFSGEFSGSKIAGLARLRGGGGAIAVSGERTR